MRVLIVDDSPTSRKLLRVILESGSHGVCEAADGVEALRALEAADYDAVICDILMPKMDGYSLCHEVRGNARLRDLPVIIYSATYTSPADEKLALEFGADVFLPKPSSSAVVLAALKDAVEGPRRRRRKPPVTDSGMTILKEYSERLVQKLEEKNVQLEQAQLLLQESELRYRRLFDLAPIGVYRSTKGGRFESVNAAFAELLGYGSVEEVLGLDIAADVYGDTRERKRWIAENEAQGGVIGFEVQLKRKDGSPVWVRIDSRVVRDSSGAVTHFEGFVHDIHRRKRAEEALRQSEERFRRSFSVSPIGMSLSEARTGRLLDVNECFAQLLGYEREELIGRTAVEVGIWAKGRDRERAVREIRDSVAIRDREVQLRTKSGEIRYILGSIEPLQLGDEHVFLSVFQDITQRKRAEKDLRASEERYRLLFDSNPQPMWVFDDETLRFLAVNQAACRDYGYSRDEFLGMTIKDIRPADEIPALERQIADAGRDVQREGGWRHRKKDGTLIDVEITSHPLTFDGRPARLIMAADVTERRLAESRIQERTTYLSALVENSPLAILVLDAEHRVQIANPEFVRMFGYTQEEIEGRNPDSLVTFDDDELAAEASAFTRECLAGRSVHAASKRRRKDGTLIDVELYGVPLLQEGRLIGVYAIYEDVTERHNLELQLRQSQKMEAIGQLAGGVAHDFNNLLTAILGYADLLSTQVPAGSPLVESVDEIRKAGERAASLTRQLLAFSRRQVLEPRLLDVNALIQNIERMLQRMIGEDIQFGTALEARAGRVLADAGQIEQVLMNLAVNARDAMPRGGRLTIETRNVELDESYAREHVAIRPGHYVMIAVTDTGIGMNAETRSHIFEPFFTTKGMGKGTGLGLATVYGIVKQSGGFIWVYSELDRGTTFKVYLPRAEGEIEASSPERPGPPARGTETILLVEDEQSVRSLASRILKARGYTVLEAASPAEALDKIGRHEGALELLLTDVVMPDLSGSELASRIEKLRPGIKVLYMSGYTDDAIVRHGLVAEGTSFIQKPFSPDNLTAKVRQVLDRESA